MGEIENTKASRSADLIWKIDEKLDKKPYSEISSAIEDNKPILKDHGGKFSAGELENYLGIFELLHDVYTAGLVDKKMLYSAYSYEVQETSNNAEVREYLKKIRKEDPDFFSGFEDLTMQLKTNPTVLKP